MICCFNLVSNKVIVLKCGIFNKNFQKLEFNLFPFI
uniref:Uncharacterized protein n=1 Tax=viral metagenome TaxID=1070528 RepID=A0A6C0H6F7_9ZZZZ